MVRKYFFLVILSFLALAGWGINLLAASSGDITFISSVDRDNISINDRLQLTLAVTGTQEIGYPDLSALNDFDILSSGSSSQFSFINGKMSSSKSFTYILIPLREGSLTIPPATVKIGDTVLKAEPITITVTTGSKTAPPPPARQAVFPQAQTSSPPVPKVGTDGLKNRIFIDIDADKNTAYTGDQITLTFRLYHRGVMIDNLQYTPPVTTGFITESMGPQREYRDTVNGVVYDVIELKTALFPATAGTLTIEPAKLTCNLLIRKQAPRRRPDPYNSLFDDFFEDSFFGSYQKYPIKLQSNPVTVTVQTLPTQGKPDIFRGAVGKYGLNLEVSPQTLKVGEPINLTMKVSGPGNITQVSEPVFSNLAHFKTYAPEIKIEITGRNPQITGTKTFQKILIPQDQTITEIPVVEFCYFDPLQQQYQTIQKGPIPITVQAAPKRDSTIVELIKDFSSDEESQQVIKLLAKDIQFIKKTPGQMTLTGTLWYQNFWLWTIFFAVPVIIFVSTAFYVSRHNKLQKDKVYAKAKGARKTARLLLDKAIRCQHQDDSKEFYNVIAKTVQQFISNCLNVPPGDVTTTNLESLLTPRGIRADTIKSLQQLLDKCDIMRFGARTAPSAEMQQTVKQTGHIISVLGKRL